MNISNEKLTKLWATKNKDDEWWSSFVTSPLAIFANYFVVDIKWLTPNIITLLSFLVALVSVALIVIGGHINFVIAAFLIQFSHTLDCMDGQMARFRKTSSPTGSYYDKLTDHLQVALWFGAVGYAAYDQTQSIIPLLLAFAGVTFYSLRGYSKYMFLYTKMQNDSDQLKQIPAKDTTEPTIEKAGISFSTAENLRWFFNEQRKIVFFNEGVFIFMLSAALIFNVLTPMLILFALSQFIYAIKRSLSQIAQLKEQNQN